MDSVRMYRQRWGIAFHPQNFQQAGNPLGKTGCDVRFDPFQNFPLKPLFIGHSAVHSEEGSVDAEHGMAFQKRLAVHAG